MAGVVATALVFVVVQRVADIADLVPLPAFDYYSSQVPPDYPVRKALAMLHEMQGDLPSRVIVNDPKLTPREASVRTAGTVINAYVNPCEAGRPVHVNAFTPLYRRARQGRPDALRALVGVLAHEAHHQRHGAGEQEAYATQRRVLAGLGASAKELQEVEASLNYALDVTRPHIRQAVALLTHSCNEVERLEHPR